MLAWVAGGVFALIGALCYAELATAYPSAGGDYHFLKRAYGRNLSFLFGWARAIVIVPGSIAFLSFLFGDYVARLLPLGEHGAAHLRGIAGARPDARQYRRHPRRARRRRTGLRSSRWAAW